MRKVLLLGAVATAFACFGFTPVAHTNVVVKDGVTYVQRGVLGTADYVVTNVDAQTVGRVQSVNGKTGVVVLGADDVGALTNTTTHLSGDVPTTRKINDKQLNQDITLIASDVNALPDDYQGLLGSEAFSNAVAEVSPPVVLPTKWALANVTNATGGAVTADNIGALPATKYSSEYHISYPLFHYDKLYTGYRYTTGLNYGLNINRHPNNDNTRFETINIWNNKFQSSYYDLSNPSAPIIRNWENEFPTEDGKLATTVDVCRAVSEAKYDHITSTNLVLSGGQEGNIIVNADLSIVEQPDPAYSVTINPEPMIPSVITGRTTRSSNTLLTYNLKGFFNSEYVYETNLGAEKWTDVWYGYACPSNISFRTTDGVWILRCGSGQVLEMPSADFPKYRVMMAQKPLLASYRMGSYMRYWVAAPNAWTTTSGGDYDETYPHTETNWFPVVQTKILRRDDMSDWAMASNKPSYTAIEVGALPSSKYLTTTSYYSDINRHAVGGLYANASVNRDYFGIYKSAGMNADWCPLYTNTQYRADHILQKVECTSTSTRGTFSLPLKFPFKEGTIARTEDLEGYVPTNRTVNGQSLTQDITIEGMTDNAVVYTNNTLKTKSGTTIPIDGMDYQAMTNTVNAVKAKFYDEPLQTEWTVRMVNGEMKLYATTNVNTSVL